MIGKSKAKALHGTGIEVAHQVLHMAAPGLKDSLETLTPEIQDRFVRIQLSEESVQHYCQCALSVQK